MLESHSILEMLEDTHAGITYVIQNHITYGTGNAGRYTIRKEGSWNHIQNHLAYLNYQKLHYTREEACWNHIAFWNCWKKRHAGITLHIGTAGLYSEKRVAGITYVIQNHIAYWNYWKILCTRRGMLEQNSLLNTLEDTLCKRKLESHKGSHNILELLEDTLYEKWDPGIT